MLTEAKMILEFKKNYLEENENVVRVIDSSASYKKLIKKKMYQSPYMLYYEAKGIVDAINSGEIKEDYASEAKNLAIVSLLAIQDYKLVNDNAKVLAKKK